MLHLGRSSHRTVCCTGRVDSGAELHCTHHITVLQIKGDIIKQSITELQTFYQITKLETRRDRQSSSTFIRHVIPMGICRGVSLQNTSKVTGCFSCLPQYIEVVVLSFFKRTKRVFLLVSLVDSFHLLQAYT